MIGNGRETEIQQEIIYNLQYMLNNYNYGTHGSLQIGHNVS